jgi:hypothetical protein
MRTRDSPKDGLVIYSGTLRPVHAIWMYKHCFWASNSVSYSIYIGFIFCLLAGWETAASKHAGTRNHTLLYTNLLGEGRGGGDASWGWLNCA